MTNEERKALVEDYRVYAKIKPFPGPYVTAADQIEADGQEIDQLRVDLEEYRRDAEDYADLIGTLQKHIAELEAALHSVIYACDQGRMVARGAGGMTIEAQYRNSVINGVPAWPIENARAALGETK